MTAVKGVNATKFDAGGQGDDAIAQGLVNSRIIVWTDEYEAAALASGSTIEMAKLPDGAKVLDVEVTHDALGSSVTIEAGDSNDANRYIAAAAVDSAGQLEANLTDGKTYVVGSNDGDDVLLLTTGGAAATGTIKTKTTFTL